MQQPGVLTLLAVFVALLALLTATVAIAEIDLGTWNFVAAVSIASIKALLIVLYFMHVRYSNRLTWLAAGAGFFWLGIMLALTLSDYISRGWTSYLEIGPRP